MTRQFSKHERDDERPRSRNSSSGSYGEERSPRPARPRLNRDTVDKAWENGARQHHSDYRARDTRGGQPPRENWRGPRRSGQPSAYNGRNNNTGNNRAPYGNRSSDYRRGEQSPDRYHGSRPRPFESGMRRFDERQYNQHRDYRPRTESDEYRPRENSRYDSNRPPSRGYQERRDDRTPRHFQRDERPQRRYEQEDRPARRYEREERQPRRFEEREPRPRGYYREQREHGAGRPDTRNSRWQSRPQRFTPKSRENERPAREREQFEGDYEQYDAREKLPDAGESREIAQPGKRAAHSPRAKQQKDAGFMTEVNQQTDSLIEHIAPVEAAQDGAAEETTNEAAPKAKKARTSRAGAAGAKASAKTTRTRKAVTNPRTPHLRPSKRGFKWPAPESAEPAEPSGVE